MNGSARLSLKVGDIFSKPVSAIQKEATPAQGFVRLSVDNPVLMEKIASAAAAEAGSEVVVEPAVEIREGKMPIALRWVVERKYLR